MNYRAYLRAIDIAMRARTPGSPIAFDAKRGAWSLGNHEVRTSALAGGTIRFGLFTLTVPEMFVGSYSGRAGAPVEEVAEYLVYFLESGKPWHHGVATRGPA